MTPDPISDLLGAVLQQCRPAAVDTAKRITSDLLRDHSLCVASYVHDEVFTFHKNQHSHEWRVVVVALHIDSDNVFLAYGVWLNGTVIPNHTRFTFSTASKLANPSAMAEVLRNTIEESTT